MLKDITLGQYFPGDSVVHRMDSRAKILLTIVYIVMLFIANNVVGLGLSVVFAGLLYVIAKIPMRMILRSLKPVIPIVIFTAVLNMFFVQGEGQPLFSWWIFKLYKEGLYTAGFMAVRIVCLIAGTSLLTYTTSPITLTDGIESLLKPLSRRMSLP